jgi:hypothetical protein
MQESLQNFTATFAVFAPLPVVCAGRWKAIAAGERAVALKPGFQLAQNNRALARQEKAKAPAYP